jgi:hypothetical protein
MGRFFDLVKQIAGRRPITQLVRAENAAAKRSVGVAEASQATDANGVPYFIPGIHGTPTTGANCVWVVYP